MYRGRKKKKKKMLQAGGVPSGTCIRTLLWKQYHHDYRCWKQSPRLYVRYRILSHTHTHTHTHTHIYIYIHFFLRPRDMGLVGNSHRHPLHAAFCKHDWQQKQTSTHHRSCSRVGDARASALLTIVREPHRTALTPHEANVGVSPTKTFQWHANKHEWNSVHRSNGNGG
jgi:hypothetical protein